VDKIDKDFQNALLGVSGIKECRLTTNYLLLAYDQGKAMGLDEIRLLKFCCIHLQKTINDDLEKRIWELNGH